MKFIKTVRLLSVVSCLSLAVITDNVGQAQTLEAGTIHASVPQEVTITEGPEFSDGIYNYKTFYADAQEEGLYFLNLWLLPAEKVSGGFTTFNVSVNGTSVGTVTPTQGNWQSAGLDNWSQVLLNSGMNTVTVGVLSPETPSVETIRLASSSSDALIDATGYEDYLDGAIASDVLSTSSLRQVAEPNGAANSKAFTGLEVRYSFFKRLEFKKGDELVITSTSSLPHSIDVVYAGKYVTLNSGDPIIIPVNNGTQATIDASIEPAPTIYFEKATSEQMQGLNWKRSSEVMKGSSSQVAKMKIIRLPYDGQYLIRVRTNTSGTYGTANVFINDEYYFDEAPIAYTHCPLVLPADGKTYQTYTIGTPSTAMPMLLIHGNDADRVVGWNDKIIGRTGCNFILDSREAFIAQEYNVPTTGVSVINENSRNPVCNLSIVSKEREETGNNTITQPQEQPAQQSPSNNKLGMPANIFIPGSVRLEETLTITCAQDLKSVRIYDISGNLLCSLAPDSNWFEATPNALNIGKSGLYLISVETEEETYSSKLVVK